jgi:3-methyladenine DNA glycosylase AlkD
MKLETAEQVRRKLQSLARADKKAFLPKFFKTGPGEYAEGDQFLGVIVPDQRTVAKQAASLPLPEIAGLLTSPYHECRLTGIFVLVRKFQVARDPLERQSLLDFLLDNLAGINNWDLVDSCASQIVGEHLRSAKSGVTRLKKMARSKNMWEQRLAIVATLAFIRNGQYQPTIVVAEQLLSHPHDLIHKAVGWMLREMGNREPELLYQFLDQHAAEMPRTALRYAIEKLPPQLRKAYLAK